MWKPKILNQCLTAPFEDEEFENTQGFHGTQFENEQTHTATLRLL
jgi:hypothetical protein